MIKIKVAFVRINFHVDRQTCEYDDSKLYHENLSLVHNY